MTTIDLFDLWQSLLTLVNVSQNGQIPPTVFQNWCNTENVAMFRDKFGNAELSQQVSDEIKAPFLVTATQVITIGAGATYGVAVYPSNYEYFSSAKIVRQKDDKKCQSRDPLPDIDADGKCVKYTDPDYAAMAVRFAADNLVTPEVQLIDNQRWDSCLTHKSKGPTYNAPKITQFQGGFKIAPAGVQLLILDYYKTPQPCFFSFTISADDILIYNAGSSVQLQWSNVLKEEFLSRLAKRYAMYIQSGEIFQMAENERKTT